MLKTLWPVPERLIREKADSYRRVVVVEMNMGQMVEDVRLAVGKDFPVFFEGRMGGGISSQEDVLAKIESIGSESGAS